MWPNTEEILKGKLHFCVAKVIFNNISDILFLCKEDKNLNQKEIFNPKLKIKNVIPQEH